MKPIILGIDPGLHGALAFVQLVAGTPRVEVFDMPIVARQVNNVSRSRIDKPALVDLIANRIHTLRRVVIEDVHALPKDGPVQAFTFGYANGLIKGMLTAYNVAVQMIAPADWKKPFGLSSDKNRSRLVASRFFPKDDAQWSRKMDDGRAEAALLGIVALQRK